MLHGTIGTKLLQPTKRLRTNGHSNPSRFFALTFMVEYKNSKIFHTNMSFFMVSEYGFRFPYPSYPRHQTLVPYSSFPFYRETRNPYHHQLYLDPLPGSPYPERRPPYPHHNHPLNLSSSNRNPRKYPDREADAEDQIAKDAHWNHRNDYKDYYFLIKTN